eukprot:Gb_04266 [translate_table: standard]
MNMKMQADVKSDRLSIRTCIALVAADNRTIPRRKRSGSRGPSGECEVIPSDGGKQDEGEANLLERAKEEEGLDYGENDLVGGLDNLSRPHEKSRPKEVEVLRDVPKEESKASSGEDEEILEKEAMDVEMLANKYENPIGGAAVENDMDNQEMYIDREKKNEGLTSLEKDLCLSNYFAGNNSQQPSQRKNQSEETTSMIHCGQ